MSNQRYPEEFKIEAVKHITERGLRVADVAERLAAAIGLLSIAGLERIQPFREAWLEDHQDTATDLLHMLVNLSVIQFTAEILAKLGDAVPASVRLFPIESPLWLQLLLVAAVLDLGL